MIEAEVKLKRWGRSFGIVVPMEKVREAGLKENELLNMSLARKNNPFLDNFGILKRKNRKNTKQLLKEIRKEGWDE
ncbi:MAG: hypothetical protein AABW80_02410 [Nanoarchaeota archaeon]